ncbi:Oidioi.mRNA.OKI2018_I69.PAR.g13226.t1.cds [Oikopleura dioica]|uniref:Oidioi.mRNA.OKI2018_I69.PAR.g13226.t1.cds n=1 Tax=Oikopleura dioica TaxID=34765 RepID=A0ABN7S9Y4_OIKDI|nr:Oidioi.mRNA.OKI2018_I69.PAR.g13226.t1.cds [Oikopleura dioica]
MENILENYADERVVLICDGTFSTRATYMSDTRNLGAPRRSSVSSSTDESTHSDIDTSSEETPGLDAEPNSDNPYSSDTTTGLYVATAPNVNTETNVNTGPDTTTPAGDSTNTDAILASVETPGSDANNPSK